MQSDSLGSLSVIVPVGPGDISWVKLCEELIDLPESTEVIFIFCDSLPSLIPPALHRLQNRLTVKILKSPKGRGKQMNLGAAEASRPFLWFLHADSRFGQDTLLSLRRSLKKYPKEFLYFDLAFLGDGPQLMRVNTLGCWIRSHYLGMPFGDQGFCLSKEVFDELGAYRTDVTSGEDHLLVWKAHQSGINLRATRGTLYTSARRYKSKGWLTTTLRCNVLTYKQAIPQWVTYQKRKWSRSLR